MMAQAYPGSPHFMDKAKESALHGGSMGYHSAPSGRHLQSLLPGCSAPGSLQELGDSGFLHLSLPLAGTSLTATGLPNLP